MHSVKADAAAPPFEELDLVARASRLTFRTLFAPAQSSGRRRRLRSPSLETRTVNRPETIDPKMTVNEIMRRWPATIRVIIHNKMLCIGCPIGIFHTMSDACEAHRIDLEAFSEELLRAMRTDPAANAPSAFQGEEVAAL